MIFLNFFSFFSNAIKFTHEGKVGINLYVVAQPNSEKLEEVHQKMNGDKSNVSANGLTEEKYFSSASQNGSDECRSPVKSECSRNGDTQEQHHSTKTTVWIRCDVYDTGIGIPGILLKSST